MRWPQNTVPLLILAVLFALPIGLRAQMNWSRVTTQIAPGFMPHTIDAADGIIVAGGNGLAVSTNLGSTWTVITPSFIANPNIVGIAIYDRNIFAIQSGTSGIYLTSDQGNSWRPLLGNGSVVPAFPLIFLGDPAKILCTTTGAFVYTRDAGNTFTTATTALNPYQFKLAADGTVRLFSRTDNDVRTASSSDTGRTWVESTVLPYKDCFSIIADPSAPGVHCLINEDFYLHQHESMIFRTSNNGSTWDTTLTHALVYLAGSSDVGCHDYFVATVNDGILRSTDQGRTWSNIGGPSVLPDFRNLVAADDSLLIALDGNGAVWVTRPQSHTWKIKVRNDIHFSNGSLILCDSVRTGMVILYPGCSNAFISRANIVGADAQDYDFLDSVDGTFPDTIRVRFTSPGPGTSEANLKIELSDSTIYNFDLTTTTIAPDIAFSPMVLMLDSLIYCQTLLDTLRLESPCPMSLTNLELLGLDSGSFTILGPKTRTLPGDSTIVILCRPLRLGQLDALLKITTQFGTTHSISLRPLVRRMPLAVVFDTIWGRDTLWNCQNGFDTIRLMSVCSLTNINVALTDSSAYRLLTKPVISLPRDSVIIVSYTSNGKTDIASYLRLRSPMLDSVDIPLRRSFKRAPVLLAAQPRIASDTFSFCLEIFDTLIFASQCPHTCLNMRFEGPDALRFRIIGSAGLSMPGDSALVISCKAIQPGQLNADLVFETEEGFTNRYRLMPVFITSPFRFTPKSLFVGDSVGACVGKFDTLRITSDCPLRIKSITISGVDAASFALVTAAPLQLPSDTAIIVRCLPGAKGKRLAVLRIELEDGRTWNVALSATIVDAPIKIVPAMLFKEDTIATCSFAFDTLKLIAPCPFNLKSATIQGPDAGLFRIEGNAPTNLPGDSNVVIRCTPDKVGQIAAHLRLEAADGRIWTVPFSPVGAETALLFDRLTLFAGDTLISCGALRDSVTLVAACPLVLSAVSIIGPDASSFTLEGNSIRNLPQDQNIAVSCIPSHVGHLDAILHIVSADGRVWDLPLQPFVKETPLIYLPASLFDKDSVLECSSLTDTLKLTSLCPLDLTDISISGVDPGSFSLSRSTIRLPDDSTIIVVCQPDHAGPISATLDLTASDGRVWKIPMSVVSLSAPVTFAPAVLFERDSLTICDSRSDTLVLQSPCAFSITNVSISGNDMASFAISAQSSGSSIIVTCEPRRSGMLDAMLEVITADGNVSDIPLTPYVSDYATLTFDRLADVMTDTLGGDVDIPITATRSGGRGGVEFTIHYSSSSLIFRGVFDQSGVDRTIAQGVGSSRIAFDLEGTTTLYALFAYFPVEGECGKVLVDSITAPGGSSSCLLNLANALQANICSPDFCGRGLLSNFLRYGDIPDLVIMPNPSAGDILLRADRPISEANIEIIDALGVVRKSLRRISLPTSGVRIETSGLSSGVYEVRLNNGSMQSSRRLILSR